MLQYLRTHTWLQLLGITCVSGGLFIFSALHNGWMNEYYSAAAQAGVTSWRAFFYVSFDSSVALSIDKPPLGIWPSSIAVAVFGFSWLSIAAPHIIAGVLTTLTIYMLVRSITRIRYGMLAVGLFLATPIVSVIFGYNQPDSIFIFMLTASLYTFYHFLTGNKAWWLVATAVLLGLGAMTKSLQVLPLIVLYGVAYLWVRKGSIKKDLGALIASAGIFVFLTLWWPLAVALTPPSERPYVGSTPDNSPWSLLFGYNGIDRLANVNQTEAQQASGGTHFGGEPGVLRLFNEEFGPNSGWYLLLIVPAFIGLYLRKNAPPKNERRIVGLAVGWTLIYGVILSSMQGIVHGYYSSILAVPVVLYATFAIKWSVGWYVHRISGRWYILPVCLAAIGFLAAYLLHYSPTVATPYAGALAVVSVVSGAFLLYRPLVGPLVWTISLSIILTGPISFTVYALSHTQTGPFPSARATSTSVTVPEAARKFLVNHFAHEPWIAASEATGYAAAIQLTTGKPVFAIGGYNGTDPVVSLEQLEALAGQGKVRYFITPANPVHSTLSPSMRTWIFAHDIVYKDADVHIYKLQK